MKYNKDNIIGLIFKTNGCIYEIIYNKQEYRIKGYKNDKDTGAKWNLKNLIYNLERGIWTVISMKEEEKWIECTYSFNADLTKGKKYLIQFETEEHYTIINDKGLRDKYYKTRFKKVDNTKEVWLTVYNPNSNNELTPKHGQKYLFIEESKHDCLLVKDTEGINVVMNKNWFKEYQHMKEKEIIGYLAPFDLFGGKVKKGDVLNQKNLSYSKDGDYTYYLPKEIVEQWEPVYKEEPKECILYAGNPLQNIKISKGKIECEGNNLSSYQISHLLLHLQIVPTVGIYVTSIPRVKIGCSEFTKEELKQVVDKYNEINDNK